MMSFTVLFAVLTLLGLIVVFAVAYALKGWKIALLATGIALVLAILALSGLVLIITRSMPN